MPELPLAAYGSQLEVAGVEICYDATTAHVVDKIVFTRVQNLSGSATDTSEVLDPNNRSDEACRVYVPAGINLSTQNTIGLRVDSIWTADTATLRLGRVTFMLAPGSADATPLS